MQPKPACRASISGFRWKDLEWDPSRTQLLARAIAERVHNSVGILICGDGRETMNPHISALIAGISSSVKKTVPLYNVGTLPTPAARTALLHSQEIDTGIVVTASHNPAGENGIKIFTSAGYPSSDEVEHIMARFETKDPLPLANDSAAEPCVQKRQSILDHYFAEVIRTNPSLKERHRVLINAGRGAGRGVFANLLTQLNQEVIEKENQGDLEDFPYSFNPSKPDAVGYTEKLLQAEDVNIGFSLDPDADRLVVTLRDPQSKECITLNGEKMAYVLSHFIKNSETLILDVMCSPYTKSTIEALGKSVSMSPTGVKSVADRMKELKSPLGVEFSGHAVFSQLGHIDDPGSMMIQMLRFIEEQGGLLSAFKKIKEWDTQNPYKYMLMTAHSFDIEVPLIYERLKNYFSKNPTTQLSFEDGIRVENPQEGYWAIIRSSNTSNSLRVRIGGKTKEIYDDISASVLECIS